MYLLDSDVFIDAKNQHYGFDFVPGFWEWLIRSHANGLVFTVERCAQEVKAVADELSRWMVARPSSFVIKPSAGDAAALQSVSAWARAGNFRQGAVAQFLGGGDYFLVGQALASGYTVVTHEVPAPLSQKRIKIPDACSALGVPWMSPFRMLRDEGARFSLDNATK